MPIPPDSLFLAIQSGWPADIMLAQGISAINGLRNGETTLAGREDPDPRFTRVTELMRLIQGSDSVGLRLRKRAGDAPSTFVAD